MELRNYIRPILAGLIGLGLVILIIVFLVRVFSSPSGTETKAVDVTTYANTGATATLVLEGPNVIDQNFREVKITIGQNSNEIDLIQGYQGSVIRTQAYPSNSAAYSTFLQSLQHQGFTNGNKDSKEDPSGYCPFGSRYLYSFNDGSTDLFSYWSTSCSTSQGTFKGSAANVRRVFANQIPPSDFSSFLSGTNIAP